MSQLLRLAYDGTDFNGFARQEGRRTVQDSVERALGDLYKQPIRIRAASRTDAGVHARGQIVAFEPPFEIPEQGLLLGLASVLSRDVVATAAWTEPWRDEGPLHPRFYNLGKHYHYRIRCSPLRDALLDRREWHFPGDLDVASMQAGAQRFVGEHDFGAFRAHDCQARMSRRRMLSVDVNSSPHVPGPEDPGRPHVERTRRPGSVGPRPATVDIHVHGEAFLKHMVRIMVGTLIELGCGRREPEWVTELLACGDRTRAGRTVPGRGLTLVEVKWPARGGS